MGFFSKLADAVTGGWVKIHLQWSEPVLGKPIQVRINADGVKSDKDIDGVYVQIVAEEKVSVPDVHLAEKVNGVLQEKIQDVENTMITYDQKFPIGGPQPLKTGQTYEWSGTITIPADAKPTYLGLRASHSWRITAGLEVKGNDPDSGWAAIPVIR
ncbi:MAG: hypothetical protein PHI34_13135 [Acidobacteriota bacterium]|nr:hypothetical protein [Acidobacteriota bacterium]